MRRLFMKNKLLALLMTITMVLTLCSSFSPAVVKADSTSSVIKKDSELRGDLLDEIMNADYNFALGKNISVSKQTTTDGGLDLNSITSEAAFSLVNSKDTIVEINRGSKDNSWVEVDLGNYYDSEAVDRIAVQYKTAGTSPTKGYTIQYSVNGIDYVDVATVTKATGSANCIFLDEMDLDNNQYVSMPYVRYVRILNTTDLSAYGMQVQGFAVLTNGITHVDEVKTTEIGNCDAPKSVTVQSSDYGQLEFSFEGAQNADITYIYYAFIDGAMYGMIAPNNEYVITDLDEGTHTVSVMSYSEGLVSDKVSKEVNVASVQNLLLNRRNIATNKDYTSSSYRTGTDYAENGATDGDLKKFFGTAQAETTAEIVIDLGADYELEDMDRVVALYVAGRYPRNTVVSFSQDNEEFQQVATINGSSALQSGKVDTSECTIEKVRYVKWAFSNAVAGGYGFQVYELGVISKVIDATRFDLDFDYLASYTGSEIEPEIEVSFMDQVLEEDVDYTVEYIDNVEVGEGTIKITGIGAFKGTVEKKFIIAPESMSNLDISHSFDKDNNLVIQVKHGDLELEEDVDYEKRIQDNRDGSYTVTLTGLEQNYYGSTEFDISADEIPVNEAANLSIVNDAPNTITISFENADKLGADQQTYDIYWDGIPVYEDVIAGTYKIERMDVDTYEIKVVAHLGDRVSDGITEELEVHGINLDSESTVVELEEASATLTDEGWVKGVKVFYDGEELYDGSDYIVEYGDEIVDGKVTYTIKGNNLYEGEVTVSFDQDPVEMDPEKMLVTTSFNEDKELELTVAYGSIMLEEDEDYEVIKDEDSLGNIKVTIKAIGDNFSGSITKTIDAKDNPNAPTTAPATEAPTKQDVSTTAPSNVAKAKVARVKIKSARNSKKKSIVLAFKKAKNAKKYKVQYATNKKFKKAKTKTIKKLKVVLKNLKKGKKYFIRVRGINGKAKGKWSKVKKVKVKK